jgi:hypothetical protein
MWLLSCVRPHPEILVDVSVQSAEMNHHLLHVDLVILFVVDGVEELLDGGTFLIERENKCLLLLYTKRSIIYEH